MVGNRFVAPKPDSLYWRHQAAQENTGYSRQSVRKGVFVPWRLGERSKWFADPETPLDWLLAKEAVEEREKSE